MCIQASQFQVAQDISHEAWNYDNSKQEIIHLWMFHEFLMYNGLFQTMPNVHDKYLLQNDVDSNQVRITLVFGTYILLYSLDRVFTGTRRAC